MIYSPRGQTCVSNTCKRSEKSNTHTRAPSLSIARHVWPVRQTTTLTCTSAAHGEKLIDDVVSIIIHASIQTFCDCQTREREISRSRAIRLMRKHSYLAQLAQHWILIWRWAYYSRNHTCFDTLLSRSREETHARSTRMSIPDATK